MVITDMDGTLLNNEHRITERNLLTIKKLKENNIKFAIATGRGKEPLCEFLNEYKILDRVDYIIHMNGVSFYNMKTGKSYDFDFMDEDIINHIYNSFKDCNISFVVHESNTVLCNKRTKYTDLECQVNKYEFKEVPDFAKIINKKYPKLMLIGEKDILDEINEKLTELSSGAFNFFRSHENFLEIVKNDVSKGTALAKLCSLENICMSNVMAFGDNLNDLDMIKYAGLGIAVDNANEELKSQARFVTKSNIEDGFAHACREILNLDKIS
jgi:Cof subfamily protein (haloacid dehalogenase superfamily)